MTFSQWGAACLSEFSDQLCQHADACCCPHLPTLDVRLAGPRKEHLDFRQTGFKLSMAFIDIPDRLLQGLSAATLERLREITEIVLQNRRSLNHLNLPRHAVEKRDDLFKHQFDILRPV